MRSRISTVILIVVLLVGLSLLLYPTVADWWNQFHSSRAIAGYSETVETMDAADYEKLLNEAMAYNESLSAMPNRFAPDEEQHELYMNTLDVTGTGIMGYINIPSLSISLPIYHSVDEGVLQVAVGHIEGTSLPVGGKGTHCVLSGHRGLPSARLFTDLDQLAEGDVFILKVLNSTFTYQVDQILIVLPEEVDDLAIDPDCDYCTLVTCTPYGVNSHRLLVRGRRISDLPEEIELIVEADAQQIEPLLVAPVLAAPVLLILFAATMFKGRTRR